MWKTTRHCLPYLQSCFSLFWEKEENVSIFNWVYTPWRKIITSLYQWNLFYLASKRENPSYSGVVFIPFYLTCSLFPPVYVYWNFQKRTVVLEIPSNVFTSSYFCSLQNYEFRKPCKAYLYSGGWYLWWWWGYFLLLGETFIFIHNPKDVKWILPTLCISGSKYRIGEWWVGAKAYGLMMHSRLIVPDLSFLAESQQIFWGSVAWPDNVSTNTQKSKYGRPVAQ